MGMYNGYLTDVKGLLVGHSTNLKARTGCTAIVAPQGAVCGVDVRGSAPGTRETDLMRPGNSVQKANAIVLSGGSAFGLEAACGAMRYLEEQGWGLETGGGKVPIVGSAVLYDLEVGDAKVRPDLQAGYQACRKASEQPEENGLVGAGTGATVGKLHGGECADLGGLGSMSLCFSDGLVVAALFAVNAVGDILDHRTGKIISGLKNADGYLNTVDVVLERGMPDVLKGKNTVIGVVATNAILTKEQANKMAAVGQDGVALSVRPAHTMFDGDTVFALATGSVQADFSRVLTASAEAAACAIENACRAAKGETK